MVVVLQVLEDLTQVFMVVVVPISELVAQHFQIEYCLLAAAAAAEMVAQVGLAIQVALVVAVLVQLVRVVVVQHLTVEHLAAVDQVVLIAVDAAMEVLLEP
jgi:hypothetical protein